MARTSLAICYQSSEQASIGWKGERFRTGDRCAGAHRWRRHAGRVHRPGPRRAGPTTPPPGARRRHPGDRRRAAGGRVLPDPGAHRPPRAMYVMLRLGFAILGAFARPIPEAPPEGELRRVRLNVPLQCLRHRDPDDPGQRRNPRPTPATAPRTWSSRPRPTTCCSGLVVTGLCASACGGPLRRANLSVGPDSTVGRSPRSPGGRRARSTTSPARNWAWGGAVADRHDGGQEPEAPRSCGRPPTVRVSVSEVGC